VVVDFSVAWNCKSTKSQLEKCDLDLKRQFLLEYVEKIIFTKDKISLQGSIPILLDAYKDPEHTSDARKISFFIERKISIEKTHSVQLTRVCFCKWPQFVTPPNDLFLINFFI